MNASDPAVIRMAIATRLRAAREQSGLSQGQAARQLGLQRPAVSEIEAGRRRVASEELTHFAAIYEVSTSWLLNNDSEVTDPTVELAARELVKLKPEDLDSVLELLRTLRKAADKADPEGAKPSQP